MFVHPQCPPSLHRAIVYMDLLRGAQLVRRRPAGCWCGRLLRGVEAPLRSGVRARYLRLVPACRDSLWVTIEWTFEMLAHLKQVTTAGSPRTQGEATAASVRPSPSINETRWFPPRLAPGCWLLVRPGPLLPARLGRRRSFADRWFSHRSDRAGERFGQRER